MRIKSLHVAAAAFVVFAACQSVPYTGRSRMMMMSQSEEKTLGEQAYRDILKKGKLSKDRKNVGLLRKVGRRLAKVADRPDFKWEFNLLKDDKMINAFCLPGGKVAFYSGILPVAKGENGIAVVMSHEIAHALARHGAERMSQGKLVNLGSRALGVILAKRPAATQKVVNQAYGLGVGVGVMLPYGRRQESEADKIGLILMTKAGYDPAQALLFWKRMEKATKGKAPSGPLAKFLSTHPTSVKRQQQIQAWLPEIRAKYGKTSR